MTPGACSGSSVGDGGVGGVGGVDEGDEGDEGRGRCRPGRSGSGTRRSRSSSSMIQASGGRSGVYARIAILLFRSIRRWSPPFASAPSPRLTSPTFILDAVAGPVASPRTSP